MKKIILLLMLLMFIGCSKDNPIVPPIDPVFESEEFALETKLWGRIATKNSSSSHEPWNGLPGFIVAYKIWNNYTDDLVVEYILHIRGARLQADIALLIPINKAPLLSSTAGLLCKKINPNLDPSGIVDGNIIHAEDNLFAIAFAESKHREEGEGAVFDWDEWFSVYFSVTIRAFTFESLSKGQVYEFESEPVEIILKREL